MPDPSWNFYCLLILLIFIIIIVQLIRAVFRRKTRQVVLHGGETLVMSQPSDWASGSLPHPVAANAAVADIEARGTHPVGVLQGLSGVLPVPM